MPSKGNNAMHVCACMYACVHGCLHVCMGACMCACKHTYMYVFFYCSTIFKLWIYFTTELSSAKLVIIFLKKGECVICV